VDVVTLDVASAIGAIVGGLFGLAADRIATRWPEHDEEHPPGRRVDWRTLVCVAIGAVAFALLPDRFAGDQLALVLFGAWFATLVLGLATDLDQRILSNWTTLPVIPVALVYAASGQNPLVGDQLLFAILAAVLIPAALYLPSIPFGAGAFGLGDVKMLVGVGLMLGGERAVLGVLFGMLVAGVTLAVLLVTKRVGRQSYVPYGPFLIIGALWVVLLRT
jgi:leader peptidase (prepilin peptidase) / N-methyltransferase